MTCPFCSADRKKHKDKCMTVYLDTSYYECYHCGEKGFLENEGGIRKIQEKTYTLPQPWKNITPLPNVVVQYFESRKISQPTLIAVGIQADLEWMPQTEGEVMTIKFPYYEVSILVNIKYKTLLDKHFKLFKDAKRILWFPGGSERYLEYTTIYIVEGEMDALAFYEAGIKNVVSVPNGANLNSNNLEYLSNSWEQIKHIKTFIIATDNDQAGISLRNDLAAYLGYAKCQYLEFPGAKDANEYLIMEDINRFRAAVMEAKDFPLVGVFTARDMYSQLDVLYAKGLDKGVSTGIPNFNLRIVKGYITTITGIPGHGKSDFLDLICLQLLRHAGWHGAFYSPENKPTELHLAKMICKLAGKSWNGPNQLTSEEVSSIASFLDGKVWWVKPERDFTLVSILDRVRDLKARYGIDYFVIDAWNKLEHKYTDSETKYIGESLDKIALFCEMENVHCFLVVHPTKMRKQKDSMKYEIPSLYDCAGSSNFANKSDNGITIYRNFEDDNKTTEVHITKVKFKHWGEIGCSNYHYDAISGRFYISQADKEEKWIG